MASLSPKLQAGDSTGLAHSVNLFPVGVRVLERIGVFFGVHEGRLFGDRTVFFVTGEVVFFFCAMRRVPLMVSVLVGSDYHGHPEVKNPRYHLGVGRRNIENPSD